MKNADLYSLQALRQLREQRASSRLATQQARCRETRSELDKSRESLHAHRERLAREAQDIYGRFSEGLSVSAWQAAQNELQRLEAEGEQLQNETEAAARVVQSEDELREQLRQQQIARQQKTAAWGALVDQRARRDRRDGERQEEADERPDVGPGGPQ